MAHSTRLKASRTAILLTSISNESAFVKPNLFRKPLLNQINMEPEPRFCSRSTMSACSWGVRINPILQYLHRNLKNVTSLKGSNWVPADNFLTQITEDRYRAWLTLLRDGNQNMVRLWGGGVYEPDVFYDICDGTFRFLLYITAMVQTAAFTQNLAYSCGKTSNSRVGFIRPTKILWLVSNRKPSIM